MKNRQFNLLEFGLGTILAAIKGTDRSTLDVVTGPFDFVTGLVYVVKVMWVVKQRPMMPVSRLVRSNFAIYCFIPFPFLHKMSFSGRWQLIEVE